MPPTTPEKSARILKDNAAKIKANMNAMQSVNADELIRNYKKYSVKPMSVEDAKLKLQEKPTNQFLAYVDVDSQKVNVLFRLKDGRNFGVVEPEA